LAKLKQYEDDIQNRHRQIVGLTDKVEELQRSIQNNGEVVELTEKVRMLESQNLKLIEKN
jgi:peptidoglycan hydrolase CwlO-like protein